MVYKIGSNMDNIELVKKARKSIGPYCTDECKSYCCRKGYLILNKNELKNFKNGFVKILENDKFSLNLGDTCPCLVDYRCTIYTKRPKACREFPIFIHGNKLTLSKRCPAVMSGQLFPFLKKLIANGCDKPVYINGYDCSSSSD